MLTVNPYPDLIKEDFEITFWAIFVIAAFFVAAGKKVNSKGLGGMEAVLEEIATGDEDKIKLSLKNFNDRVFFCCFSVCVAMLSY